MRASGIVIIAICTLIPLYWFIPLTTQHDTSAIISQYLASVALILMAISQMLATRFIGVESIFGPMDRVYILHKWLSVSAITLIALHDILDAELDNIQIETLLSDSAETFGEVGYYGLLILGIITLVPYVPYHYWKWSHRFMGLFFIMGVFHFAFIIKPFDLLNPLGLYILVFCFLGTLSYLYLLLPKRFNLATTSYRVNKVDKFKDGCQIYLTPKNKGIKHKSGQFSFIRFTLAKFQEVHPFTISSAPNNSRTLSFTIKSLGKFTRELKEQIKPGVTVEVSRAFGHFSLNTSAKGQIWIAAGIGITPFVAWAQTLKKDWATPITLYYCITDEHSNIYQDVLESIENEVENFSLKMIVSKNGQRLTSTMIRNDLNSPLNLNTQSVYFCGPKQMRRQLKEELITLGVKKPNFHYEEFEIRTGIGFLKLIRSLLLKLVATKDKISVK